MTGDEIRAARERAGLTQQQLAATLGVSTRTVGNWERGETIPRNRRGAIRSALSGQLGRSDTPALDAASDAELLAEIARRFARTEHRKEVGNDGGSTPTSRPAQRPDHDAHDLTPDDVALAARQFPPGGGQLQRFDRHMDTVGEESQDPSDEDHAPA